MTFFLYEILINSQAWCYTEYMLANYGYRDGSGEYFITIDTDKCDGCAKCVTACPSGVLEVGEDIGDPLRDTPVARVTDEQRKKIAYTCGACKTYLSSASGGDEMKIHLPCSLMAAFYTKRTRRITRSSHWRWLPGRDTYRKES